MSSNKRSKNTNSFAGLVGGSGRKRKGNFEDLIHQFIIQDPNVKATKPESSTVTGDSEWNFKKNTKKVKVTPETPEKSTSSKFSSQAVKSREDTEGESTGLHSQDYDNGPMFPEEHEPSPKASAPKKRQSRAKKDKTEEEKPKRGKARKENMLSGSSPAVPSQGEMELENEGPSYTGLDRDCMFPEEYEPKRKTPQKKSRAKKEKKEITAEEAREAKEKKKSQWVSRGEYLKKKKEEREANKKAGAHLSHLTEEELAELPPVFPFNDNQAEEVQTDAKLPYWLQEEHLKDAEGHSVNDEDYDPKTLSIPTEEFESLPNVQRKYWDYKCKYFDKVVAFRMWACYFFYANDALLLHKHFDTEIGYYKGRLYSYIHEKTLWEIAPKLLRLGHKLVIIKLPDKKEESEKYARDVFQILTRGTYQDNPEITYASQFCLCIYEHKDNIGIVYFDATTHEFYIGEFTDDAERSNLRTIVTKIKPVEIVYLRNFLSQQSKDILSTLPSKPSMTQFQIPGERSKPNSEILSEIIDYFASNDETKSPVPDLLKNMKAVIDMEQSNLRGKKMDLTPEEEFDIQEKTSHYYTVRALSICLNYLKDLMLADAVFAIGHFAPYDLALDKKSTLYLDSQALQNLEVFDVEYLNTGKNDRSLFGYMDKTVSDFGKRMFKKWILSPLLDVHEINERQEAVQDLIDNDIIADFFQSQLKELPDLERIISKIYNLASRKKMTGVKFEDFIKNKLVDFLNLLEQLEKVETFMERFEPYIPKFKSKRLVQLVSFKEVEEQGSNKKSSENQGLFPRVGPILAELKKMVRVKEGLLVPAPGVDEEVDKILANIDRLKEQMQVILEEYKGYFKYKWLKFVHTKMRYEIEIPEEVLERIDRPKDSVITSKKKGFIRIHVPKIEETLNELHTYEMSLHSALVTFIAGYFRQFYDKNLYWHQIVICLAELDCLCGLAKFSKTMPVSCRPNVFPTDDKLTFELRGMVHPMIAPQNPNFIANDFVVEGEIDTFLITGPNMGGKSTLLRQICLAVIMAQVGSFVPATYFRLSAVDRIFTRIGASDRIAEGKSTFFIELEETYNILMEASRNSLVIIDELGRGTSTYDGVSIAYATLKYIAENIRCITLFATHYHLLLEEFKLYKNVGSYYMASEMDKEKDEIHFKYKFEKGQADKSHGVVIAKMAGLPENVLKIANEKAVFMTNEKRNIGFQKSLADKFNKIIEELDVIECEDDGTVSKVFDELCHL